MRCTDVELPASAMRRDATNRTVAVAAAAAAAPLDAVIVIIIIVVVVVADSLCTVD